MRNGRNWVAAAAAVAVAALALGGAGLMAVSQGRPAAEIRIPHDDPRAVAAGRTLYAEHCAACHGADLEGEPDWRERDADGYLPAPPHDETGHTWHHPDAQLFDITKRGIEAVVGGGYRSRMIGYDGILTDDEILAVLAYIKSTWPARVVEVHDEINAAAR